MSPLAAILFSAAAALAASFACRTVPAVFRALPPGPAGPVFSRLARRQLTGAAVLTGVATALAAARAGPAALGASALLLLLSERAWNLPGLERARELALASPPDGPLASGALLESHSRLRRLRLGAGAASLLSAAAALLLVMPRRP